MIDAPDFMFGIWHLSEGDIDDALELPWFELRDGGRSFVAALGGWVLPGFAWRSWLETDEAQRLSVDPAAMAEAGPETIARLLTALVRQDRFVEGTLAGAFDDGLLARIVARAAVLARVEGDATS